MFFMNPIARHTLRAASIVAAAIAPAAAADVAGGHHREPQAIAFAELRGFVTATDGSIWSWDGDAVRRTGTDATTYTAYRGDTGFNADSRALADGRVMLVAGSRSLGGQCTFLRIGIDMREPSRFTHADCYSVAVSANGNTWIVGVTTLYQLDSDGVELRRLPIGAADYHRRLVALADGGVMLQSRTDDGTQSRLTRFDAQGSMLWLRAFASGFQFATAADGGAFVARLVDHSLSVTRLDAGGTTRWTREGMGFDPVVMQVATTPGGAAYVVGGRHYFNTVQPYGVTYLSDDGQTAWQRAFCEGASFVQDALTVDSDGNSAVVCHDGNGDHLNLLRRNEAGTVLARIALPFHFKIQASAEPSGALRLLGTKSSQHPDPRPGFLRMVDIDREHRVRAAAANEIIDDTP